MTAMRNVLQDSAAGRHALDVMQRYGVSTRFDTSDGGFYRATTVGTAQGNTMTMNPNWDPSYQTTATVHEMNHAQAWQEGTSANRSIGTMSREEYVDGMLQEEAHSDAAANQAYRELEENGHDMSSSPAANAPAYDRGYNQGVADAGPDATWEETDAAGRQAGEQSVLDDYRAGRVTNSADGQPYTDYYGSAWDRAHP